MHKHQKLLVRPLKGLCCPGGQQTLGNKITKLLTRWHCINIKKDSIQRRADEKSVGFKKASLTTLASNLKLTSLCCLALTLSLITTFSLSPTAHAVSVSLSIDNPTAAMKLVEGGGIAIAGNTVHFSTDSTNNMNFTVTASSPNSPNMTTSDSGNGSDSNSSDGSDSGDSNGNQTAIKATTATFVDPKPLSEDLTWGYAAIYDGMNNQFNNTNDGYSSTDQTIQANNKYAGLTTTPTAIAKGNDLNSSTAKTIQAHYAARINDINKLKPGNYSTSIVYTLTAEEIVPPPSITSISPNYVPLKTSNQKITIAGTNMSNVQYVYIDINRDTVEATDGSEDCKIANPTTDITDTAVKCTVPAQTTPGTYNVYIVTTSNQSVTGDNAILHYLDAMQSMTTAFCNSLTTPSSSATQLDTTLSHQGDANYVPELSLTDVRDGTIYKVRKLADGNCWMVENLALGTTNAGGLTLTNQDTDLNSQISWKLPKYDTVGATWAYGTNDAHTVQGSPSADTSWIQGMGDWYTWGAATAGTAAKATTSDAEAADSICPKGWRLPLGGGQSAWGSTTSKSFGNLLRAYGQTDIWSAASSKLRSAPLSFPFSGYYNNQYYGTVYSVGSEGDYWSSTAYVSDSAYYLGFNSGNIFPQSNISRDIGQSVRCVSR